MKTTKKRLGIRPLACIAMIALTAFASCGIGYSPGATYTGVSVTPQNVTVTVVKGVSGATQQFDAIVLGEHGPRQDVYWKVEGEARGGGTYITPFINNSGVLTVSENESALSLTVRASANGDNMGRTSGTATVTIEYGVPPTYKSITAFKAALDASSYNTAETPYHFVLEIDNLGGSSSTTGSLGDALIYRYVSLDLSGSTFDTIPTSAFENCYRLTSVTIPDSVTSIGNRAFYNCQFLTSATIGNSVTTIGANAFDNCNRLTSVTIPASVTSIGNSAFSRCSGLTGVTIPASVTSIGNSAFSSCSGLTSVTIPASVTSIGDSAFSYCTGLTSVTIPAGITSIPNSMFRGCTSLTDISSILAGRTTIGSGAFENCYRLTSVTIPASVTSIGGSAFSYCEDLTSVTIGNGVTSIGSGAFFNCTSLTSVTIPNSVTTIGYNAFRDCPGLTSVTFERAGTYIDWGGDYGSFPNGASLQTAYQTGGVGTYTLSGSTWTKQ